MHVIARDYEMTALTSGRQLVLDIKVRVEEKDRGKGKEKKSLPHHGIP